MRKFVGALVVIGFAASASAAVLTFDNFNVDGGLVAGGGWTNHSGSGSLIQVTGGQAVLTHGGGSREDANRAFTPAAGTVYYGINFSVDDLGTPVVDDGSPDFEYFAHFKDGGFGFTGRLDIVAATGAGDFSVGIGSTDSIADAVWPTDLTFGTSYRAVVGFDQVANQAQLWIDAALSTDPSILGTDQTGLGVTATAFALRQSFSDVNETVRVGGLAVGTTFEDVVNKVPEPASLLLLSVGALALIRRR